MSALDTVDLSLSLDRETYVRQLRTAQLQLRLLAHRLYEARRSVIVVFEGWDAAGKGGAIRRLTEMLDPRGYQVSTIAAPAGDDATHHYLWRFWRRLVPADEKQILIFDRSWYGRVMVERLEEFATVEEWKRAYREINDFERELTDFGTIVVKFWMHISPGEQLARFESRKRTLRKAWKLTDEDWRNRDRWDDYAAAVDDMLVKTSTLRAPWVIVEANDKYYARVKVVRVLVETVAGALGIDPPEILPKQSKNSDKKN